ncbi:MAG: 30S ribosomal protein S1 [Anaerolineaceae bacterium]|nr:30S ribosomal protein S1 [Anaerolineaceae bacterium]
MVRPSILRQYGLQDSDIEGEVAQVMSDESGQQTLPEVYEASIKNFEVGGILPGKVINVFGDSVVIDIGYKSEGTVGRDEFDDPSGFEIGTAVEVLLEAVDSESGQIVLSKRKADRIRGWERIISEHTEGDVVEGRVMRKIKGGLLVDIGVPVFLPASQVDIRRPSDIAEYIGREIKCKILKIDQSRRNIVVSRRRLIEEQREESKKLLLAEIQIGELRRGTVKNIADFGAFVDLGGIDGLLHITDISWTRIGHPSEKVKIEEELEVVILNVDREKEKIALGLKQKEPSPWENVEEKYPIGSKVTGTAVNIMNYGAFVKLEDGIEGLVHISEMSWTKRINHPSEMVQVGDEVEVVVLDINKGKQEISLGMKQTEVNPWTLVKDKYPPGSVVEGKVRNLTNYGAFIEIEEGIDGLLHVSDMSWTRKISHPNEIVKKGDVIKAQVLNVDQDKKRVALGLKQLEEDPWESRIPSAYVPGEIVKGTVTKITNFGVFVELEGNLEGLLHVSELADHKVENPEDVVKVGQELEVKILRVDTDERKIGLSLKRAQWAAEDAEDEQAPGDAPKRERARLGGIQEVGDRIDGIVSDVLFSMPKAAAPASQEPEAPAAAQATDTTLRSTPLRSTREPQPAEKGTVEEPKAEEPKIEEAKPEEASQEEAAAAESGTAEEPAPAEEPVPAESDAGSADQTPGEESSEPEKQA